MILGFTLNSSFIMNNENKMSSFYQSIRRWLPAIQSQQERDDSYLAEAVDIYDLERRMREIDARGRSHQTSSLGVGLR